jgi:predicted dehydrogenase
MVSRHHLIAWSRNRDATVVAIADPDRKRAEARAQEFGIAQVYTDSAEMLDVEAPDVFDIAAPMSMHHPLIELAAARRIDVLCQKPLAPTLAEAVAATDAAARIRMMVHENWRFRPHYRTIKGWLEDGLIGEPRMFRLEALSSSLLPQDDGSEPAGLTRQPFFKDMDRLLVLELLIHHLDVLDWLFGPVKIRTASLARLSEHVRGEDTATIALAADAVDGLIFASMAASGTPPKNQDHLTILGTDGRIELAGKELVLNGRKSEVRNINLEEDYQASYDNAIRHLTDCLRCNGAFETPPEVHLRALRAAEEIYRYK